MYCAVDFWEDKTIDLANVEDENSHWVVRVTKLILTQFLVSIKDIDQTEEAFPSFLYVGLSFRNLALVHVAHG